MEDRVTFIFWNCWDPLHTLKLQVFFAPCQRNITKHILMIFPTLHERQLSLCADSGLREESELVMSCPGAQTSAMLAPAGHYCDYTTTALGKLSRCK